MNVKDVMTSPVLSVELDSPILQAIRIMLQRHISGLPVIDKEGRLVGIVTEGDFLRRAKPERSGADRVGSNSSSGRAGLRTNIPAPMDARCTRS